MNCKMDMDKCTHTCCAVSNVCQTLNELDFERGLWYAAQYGDLNRVIKLVNQRVDVDGRDASGYTSLHYAARNGHLEVCKFLLEKGADINAVTKSGCATALHRAVSAGHTNIVKYLLDKNASCILTDSDGKTILHRAAENQNKEMCEVITSLVPHLKSAVDNRGKRPVDYAASEDLTSLLSN